MPRSRVRRACRQSVGDLSTVRRVGREQDLVFLATPDSRNMFNRRLHRLMKTLCVICGLTLQFQQFLPRSFSLIAEDHNVVLTLVEIET
jgi:hypothetical protein